MIPRHARIPDPGEFGCVIGVDRRAHAQALREAGAVARACQLLHAEDMNDSTKKPMQRRDGAGHLDPLYAESLRKLSQESTPQSSPEGFIPEGHSADPLAEELGESFVRAATSGEDDETERLDEVVVEELGGPFVSTTGAVEYAQGTDESNPMNAKREPFPKT